jgi:hypothetical protein
VNVSDLEVKYLILSTLGFFLIILTNLKIHASVNINLHSLTIRFFPGGLLFSKDKPEKAPNHRYVHKNKIAGKSKKF